MLTISSVSLRAFVLSLTITLFVDFCVMKPIKENYVPCPVWLMRYVTGYEMQPTMAVIWMTTLLYVIIRFDLRGLAVAGILTVACWISWLIAFCESTIYETEEVKSNEVNRR